MHGTPDILSNRAAAPAARRRRSGVPAACRPAGLTTVLGLRATAWSDAALYLGRKQGERLLAFRIRAGAERSFSKGRIDVRSFKKLLPPTHIAWHAFICVAQES